MIARLITRLLLAALFLFAGALHLCKTSLFLQIMPPFIPFHRLCVVLSGIFELMGAAGLLIPARSIQIITGWGLTALLVAVFPANIYMAMDHVRVHGLPSQPWVAWARLPLQPLLVLAVLWATRLWPPARSPERPAV